MLLKKDSEGGAGAFYWEHAGDVLDVPTELAQALIKSNHLGFHLVDPNDEVEEKPKPRQKLAPKDQNPIGSLKEAVQVATGK